MSKLRLLALIGLCAALVPTLAAAGEPTGACYVQRTDAQISVPGFVDGKFDEVAFCFDDVTEAECDFLEGPFGDWQEDVPCLSVDTPFDDWDGSCLADIGDPVGLTCVLIWVDPQEEFTAQDICESKGQGTWSDDPAECAIPVPTIPAAALALMALLLLAGSLGVLSFKRSGA